MSIDTTSLELTIPAGCAATFAQLASLRGSSPSDLFIEMLITLSAEYGLTTCPRCYKTRHHPAAQRYKLLECPACSDKPQPPQIS
ncbi:hypothetical protein [Oleidesulfovibrio sp.]|uniref:hypothetical protein n=1 Tax=Oleidesulfovibrio sp. TaxID=2909707 RepID=UPI003A8AE445